MSVETNNSESDQAFYDDRGSSHDGEDIIYNEDTEMSSYLPVSRHELKENYNFQQQLSCATINWPSVDEKLNQFTKPFLAFPTLFPDGKGDPTNPS